MSSTTKKIVTRAKRQVVRAAKAIASGHRGARNKLSISGGAPKGRPKGAQRKSTAKGRGTRLQESIVPATITNTLVSTTTSRVTTIPRTSEFITGLKAPATTGFAQLTGLVLSPGNSLLCPALSVRADAYEKYRWVECQIEYIPASGTSRDGALYMYIDQDPDDTVPTSSNMAMQNGSAIEMVPYQHSVVRYYPKSAANAWYYVKQTQSNSADANSRLENAGVFRIFSEGCAANTALGSLRITYKVQFMQAKTIQPLAFSAAHVGSFLPLTPSFLWAAPLQVVMNKGFTSMPYPGGFLADLTNEVTNHLVAERATPLETTYAVALLPSKVYEATATGTVTVTNAVAWLIYLMEWDASATRVAVTTLMSGTGTGSAQLVDVGKVLTTNANTVGAAIVYSMGATGAAFSTSLRFHLGPLEESQVGAELFPGNSIVSRDETFTLPKQRDAAIASLVGHKGEVILTCVSLVPNPQTQLFKEFREWMEERKEEPGWDSCPPAKK